MSKMLMTFDEQRPNLTR